MAAQLDEAQALSGLSNNSYVTMRIWDKYLEAPEYPSSSLFLLSLVTSIFYLIWSIKSKHYGDGIPTVNLVHFLEPDLFARLRWAVNSINILTDAHQKFKGQVYRLARGDVDILVLPHRYISELNRLPAGCIDSRNYHAWAMLGHLTRLDVVRSTGHHVKVLLNRTTPAIPRLFTPMAQRLARSLKRLFPKEGEDWKVMELLDPIVQIVTEGTALALFGPPICDDPELIELCYKHTKDVFIIVFIMRCVPSIFQPWLVWLLPAKWRLTRGWKTMSSYTFPEVQRRRHDIGKHGKGVNDASPFPDLLSWMIRDGEAAKITDPLLLTHLSGSVAAGGTYSTANFICRCISDLTANPDVLAAVRVEIATKHAELRGRCWTLADVESLEYLESAMKETSRLSQGAVITYSRVASREVVLSDRLRLREGQFITVSSYNRTMDPDVFVDPHKYNGLRFMPGSKDAEKLGNIRTKPFRVVDNDVLGWGAGRWACPGRFVASVIAKSALIKIFNEFDFEFVNGKEPPLTVIHEFGFWHPNNKIRVRHRSNALEIRY